MQPLGDKERLGLKDFAIGIGTGAKRFGFINECGKLGIADGLTIINRQQCRPNLLLKLSAIRKIKRYAKVPASTIKVLIKLLGGL